MGGCPMGLSDMRWARARPCVIDRAIGEFLMVLQTVCSPPTRLFDCICAPFDDTETWTTISTLEQGLLACWGLWSPSSRGIGDPCHMPQRRQPSDELALSRGLARVGHQPANVWAAHCHGITVSQCSETRDILRRHLILYPSSLHRPKH